MSGPLVWTCGKCAQPGRECQCLAPQLGSFVPMSAGYDQPLPDPPEPIVYPITPEDIEAGEESLGCVHRWPRYTYGDQKAKCTRCGEVRHARDFDITGNK
jgi:hypothetical protein